MVLEIGRTCYTVNLILKESGKENYKDKGFRLLEQDIENKQEKNFEEICIMTLTNLPKCEHIAVQNENIYLKKSAMDSLSIMIGVGIWTSNTEIELRRKHEKREEKNGNL